MMNQLLANLGDIGNRLVGAFLFPGDILLSLFASLAPNTVEVLTFGNGAVIMRVVMALGAWTVIAIMGLLFLRFCQNLVRQVSAMALTIWHRTTTGLAGLKMRIAWKLRALLPRGKRPDEPNAPTIEFDELDMAVLRTVSSQGPGFALSAPDLAEEFTLRPAQVQKSLDKLSSNKLLASVIGSTDGFDNYRLTDSGLAFVAMWSRQQARG